MGFIDLFMQCVLVITLSVIAYIFLFQYNRQRKDGFYTLPYWNFFLKKIWARRKLLQNKKNSFEYITDFLFFKSENIKIAANSDNFDSQMIFGSDHEQNSILVKIVKRNDYSAEVWLILQLKNGQVYTLVDHPNTSVLNVYAEGFEVAGLKFERLAHYKSWRITFNGLLKHSNATSAEDNFKFIKFNFIWASVAAPQHYPDDWSVELRSTALATEPWRGGDWLNYLSTPNFGGYDQFGSMFGQVFIEKEDNENNETEMFELNLPGLRQRRCLSDNLEHIRRSVTILGTCKDGNVFILGAKSFTKYMTEAQFGSIRLADGKVYPIDWTDFHLKNIADEPDNIPRALCVLFKANGKMFNTTIYFRSKGVLPLTGNKPILWNSNIVPIEIGLNGEHGHGLAILTYSSKLFNITHSITNKTNTKSLNRLVYSNAKPNGKKLAIPFEDFEAQSILIAGGKGASLALLSSVQENQYFKFKVPAGFVLSVSAYELQLNRNAHLKNEVNQIKEIAFGVSSSDDTLETACQRTVDAWTACSLEPEILAAITDLYNNLKTKDTKFAVRSSAIGEDSDDASSAGQNETFLGLRSLEEISEGVQKCWASLFTYQSVAYRRQHIQPIDTQMAVVVQIMVPSDCAGVLFTRHPATGDPSKILITANYGLGESVVSGTVDPDSYIVKRDYRSESFRVFSKQLGTKSHAIGMSSSEAEGMLKMIPLNDYIPKLVYGKMLRILSKYRISDQQAISIRELSKDDQNKACLSDEQLLQLAQLGVLLEQMYGSARDIEWAIYQNEIYLLQSRPITTLNKMSNWELLHEFDSAIMSPDDLNTFANVGEVFPDAVTPLTYSTICRVLCKSTSQSVSSEVEDYTALFSQIFTYSHHRLLMDVYKVFLRLVDKKLNFGTYIQGVAIFGHAFVTPEIHRIAAHRNGIAPSLLKFKLILDIIKSMWICKKHNTKLKSFIKSNKNSYSLESLSKEFNKSDAFLFNSNIDFDIFDEDRLGFTFDVHGLTTKCSSFAQIILFSIMAEGSNDLTNDHFADIGMMLGTAKNVESAEVPTMLEAISNEIYLSGLADEFEKIPSQDCLQWLEQNCISAARIFKEFIDKHEHRSLKEFDLSSITWGMKPELVIDMLKATLVRDRDATVVKPQKSELKLHEVLRKLKTPLKTSTKKILSLFLPLATNSVQYRESSKSSCIAFTHVIRKAYRHLAELLYREGLLPNTELIFYLTFEELAKLLKPQANNAKPINKAGLIQKAMRRMKLFPTWNSYRFNELNTGIIKPINDTEDEVQIDGSVQVSGTPVYEGTVVGRACVLKHFSEVSKIQPGDILITHATDIGWSPYFPILGGVVTELGGLISHGAVVAREYGLPCIIGAQDATNKFKFGDRVMLNSGKGIIVKVTTEDENGVV